MLPKDFDKSYTYKGKIPIKSGYSTKILVHKEGSMTNEEIYKYADKALKNQEKRYNSIVLGTAILFVVGLGFMYITLGLSDVPATRMIAVIVCGFTYLVPLFKYSDKYYKMRRDFTYNLVRQDERKRLGM